MVVINSWLLALFSLLLNYGGSHFVYPILREEIENLNISMKIFFSIIFQHKTKNIINVSVKCDHVWYEPIFKDFTSQSYYISVLYFIIFWTDLISFYYYNVGIWVWSLWESFYKTVPIMILIYFTKTHFS